MPREGHSTINSDDGDIGLSIKVSNNIILGAKVTTHPVNRTSPACLPFLSTELVLRIMSFVCTDSAMIMPVPYKPDSIKFVNGRRTHELGRYGYGCVNATQGGTGPAWNWAFNFAMASRWTYHLMGTMFYELNTFGFGNSIDAQIFLASISPRKRASIKKIKIVWDERGQEMDTTFKTLSSCLNLRELTIDINTRASDFASPLTKAIPIPVASSWEDPTRWKELQNIRGLKSLKLEYRKNGISASGGRGDGFVQEIVMAVRHLRPRRYQLRAVQAELNGLERNLSEICAAPRGHDSLLLVPVNAMTIQKANDFIINECHVNPVTLDGMTHLEVNDTTSHNVMDWNAYPAQIIQAAVESPVEDLVIKRMRMGEGWIEDDDADASW